MPDLGVSWKKNCVDFCISRVLYAAFVTGDLCYIAGCVFNRGGLAKGGEVPLVSRRIFGFFIIKENKMFGCV
jgi:hypothetical protein